MRRLKVRSRAQAEISNALAWYLDRSPEAAQRFLEEVDVGMRAIREAPERYPTVRGQLRRRLLDHFPYGIYYKVFPTVISVVGVIHGSRHPDAWLDLAAP